MAVAVQFYWLLSVLAGRGVFDGIDTWRPPFLPVLGGCEASGKEQENDKLDHVSLPIARSAAARPCLTDRCLTPGLDAPLFETAHAGGPSDT
eukprot:scaffold14825_cov35-Tisochrysis_lutea.AAC.2